MITFLVILAVVLALALGWAVLLLRVTIAQLAELVDAIRRTGLLAAIDPDAAVAALVQIGKKVRP